MRVVVKPIKVTPANSSLSELNGILISAAGRGYGINHA
jgi:hypothetical protein